MTSHALAGQRPTSRPPRRRIIVMVGAPGAGKGTQARAPRCRALGLAPHLDGRALPRGRRDQHAARATRCAATSSRAPSCPTTSTVEMIDDRLGQGRRRRGRHPRRLPAHPRAGRGARRLARAAGRRPCSAALYVEVSAGHAHATPGRTPRLLRRTSNHVYHVTSRPAAHVRASATSTARGSSSATTTSPRRSGRRARTPAAADVRGHRPLRRRRRACRRCSGDQPVDEVTDDLLHALPSAARAERLSDALRTDDA